MAEWFKAAVLKCAAGHIEWCSVVPLRPQKRPTSPLTWVACVAACYVMLARPVPVPVPTMCGMTGVIVHVMQAVRGAYGRHACFDEKKDALERLAALVKQIVAKP